MRPPSLLPRAKGEKNGGNERRETDNYLHSLTHYTRKTKLVSIEILSHRTNGIPLLSSPPRLALWHALNASGVSDRPQQ